MLAFIQSLLDGILLGGIYGVISIGLSLVFGVLGIVNFAQAQFMMLGMYAAWFAWDSLGLDPILGVPLTGAVIFIIGYAIEKLLLQPVLKAPPVAQIFLTVGLMILLENAVLLIFGSSFKSVVVSYQQSGLKIFGLFISVPYLFAFSAAVIVCIALWLFLSKTWFGRAIRATAQDENAAVLCGVNVKQVYALTFAVGVALTAIGGAVILPYMTVSPTVGGQFAILMFTVVVLGGLGNVAGALVGGLVVGVIQSLSAMVLPVQLQNLILFMVFIGILAFKPEGLLKEA
ncbi:MAG: branched-chain amino acid ABC transporter permease [Succinivibrio sp.]|nr:branched-chain amino acid ABC transporter permease [Succinivibrio sp.]